MKKWDLETEVVHFSKRFGEKGSFNVPIYQSSTFKQQIPGEWEQYTYTRTNNPTEEALRHSIAGLENGKYGVMFSSGLAAIGAVMELLSPGDHVISTADVYGGTQRLFSRFIERRGIQFTFVDTTKLEAVESALRDNTKLIYVETPSNPLLSITDLQAVSALAKKNGALLAVDNTMATPCLQRPLDLGADLALHSCSKYLSGHTNVIGGAVVANDSGLLEQLRFIHKAVGGVPGPFDCYLTMLGLKTLAVRMKQHQENAMRIAQHLKGHPRIAKIYYPGLPEHPQHELAARQMSGFGGVISIELDGNEEVAMRFLQNLELFSLAISFGSVTSLVNYPARMTHKDMPKEERRARGFADTLIRLSVGIEKDTDLIADLEQGFKAAYGELR